MSGNAGWPTASGRSTTFPSRSAPSRRCPLRSKVTSLKGCRWYARPRPRIQVSIAAVGTTPPSTWGRAPTATIGPGDAGSQVTRRSRRGGPMAEQGFRITYATLTADNEELHEVYDHGIEVARSWLGEKHPSFVDGEAREGRGTRPRSPIDRDPDRQVRARDARGRARRGRRGQAAFPTGPTALAGAGRDPRASAADIMSDQRNELVGAHGDGGRQEPARGARRRRGVRRPASATTATRWRSTTGSRCRWVASARRASLTTSCGRTACGR